MNFSNFLESKEEEKKSKALEVILKGNNLDRRNNFWDDFLHLCGNAEGFANILDVPKEKITGAFKKINSLRSKIENKKETKFKDKLIKTGDNVDNV